MFRIFCRQGIVLAVLILCGAWVYADSPVDDTSTGSTEAFTCVEPVLDNDVLSNEGLRTFMTCTATADCDDGSTVMCSGNSSCSASDANCPYTRGHVTCDGASTFCPACEDPCPDDEFCDWKGCGISDPDCHDLCVEVDDCMFNRDCFGGECTPMGTCIC